jgi:DNA segregation ATPase FtsK/SpoIIIE, S-DNA-T family
MSFFIRESAGPYLQPRWRAFLYEKLPTWTLFIFLGGYAFYRLCRFLARHAIAFAICCLLIYVWLAYGWITLVILLGSLAVVLTACRFLLPGVFSRWVERPVRSSLRRSHYRRHWGQVMTVIGLTSHYRGRTLMPVLRRVTATSAIDTVIVKLRGQTPTDLSKKAENLAHAYGAILCRVRTAKPGRAVLQFVLRDTLTAIVPAPALPEKPDLGALPMGVREDGQPWRINLLQTHLLIAGATGAGKASLLWGIIRNVLPLARTGVVRILAADPKLMELAYGRAIFEAFGEYAADAYSIVVMLERAVLDMQRRAAKLAGRERNHTPSTEYPFVLIVVDEVAFLTTYQSSRELRVRTLNALATLTTQGRAVGYCVIAALQDPHKEVIVLRHLFPDRIAMRLDEPDLTDMVLGYGARAKGAACEQIPTDPETGAGVAFVKLESDPIPIRVRAGWVSDADILTMAREYAGALTWDAAQPIRELRSGDYARDLRRAARTGFWQTARVPPHETHEVAKLIADQAKTLDLPIEVFTDPHSGVVAFRIKTEVTLYVESLPGRPPLPLLRVLAKHPAGKVRGLPRRVRHRRPVQHYHHAPPVRPRLEPPWRRSSKLTRAHSTSRTSHSKSTPRTVSITTTSNRSPSQKPRPPRRTDGGRDAPSQPRADSSSSSAVP